MVGEIAFAWSIPMNDPRRTRLHQGLFGRKVVKTLKNGDIREYYYNGILMKWNGTKRVVDCRHAILGESLFSIPDMQRKKFEQTILDLFKELRITVRRLRLVENDLFTWN